MVRPLLPNAHMPMPTEGQLRLMMGPAAATQAAAMPHPAAAAPFATAVPASPLVDGLAPNAAGLPAAFAAQVPRAPTVPQPQQLWPLQMASAADAAPVPNMGVVMQPQPQPPPGTLAVAGLPVGRQVSGVFATPSLPVPGTLAAAGLAAAGLAAPAVATPAAPPGASPEQMAEYARYVAALQLQYAAVGTMATTQSAGQPVVGMPILAASHGCGNPVPTHDPDRRYSGSVFKWDDDQGWGFISCLDARKVYGKDVFLHKAEIGGVADLYRQRTKVDVKNGDWVSFSVEISRGKPRARDVQKIDTPEEYRKSGEGKKAEESEPGTNKSEPDTKKRRTEAE